MASKTVGAGREATFLEMVKMDLPSIIVFNDPYLKNAHFFEICEYQNLQMQLTWSML